MFEDQRIEEIYKEATKAYVEEARRRAQPDYYKSLSSLVSNVNEAFKNVEENNVTGTIEELKKAAKELLNGIEIATKEIEERTFENPDLAKEIFYSPIVLQNLTGLINELALTDEQKNLLLKGLHPTATTFKGIHNEFIESLKAIDNWLYDPKFTKQSDRSESIITECVDKNYKTVGAQEDCKTIELDEDHKTYIMLVLGGHATPKEISNEIQKPISEVGNGLKILETKGLLKHEDGIWKATKIGYYSLIKQEFGNRAKEFIENLVSTGEEVMLYEHDFNSHSPYGHVPSKKTIEEMGKYGILVIKKSDEGYCIKPNF